MRQRGAWLILVNRFLPGIRGIIYFAAGAAEMPARQVLVLGTVSAAAFNLLILGVGIAVGGNAERLEGLLRSYQQAVYLALGALGLLLLLRFLWGRRKASAAAKRNERR
jgi:membrane protein DedA with SNARE-associated domain